jgi:UDP-glucuronate decarboxylase
MAATPAATPAAAASKRTIKRCLVAGGAGFVGSHLCTRLVEEGHDVICLDSLLTGERSNVAHLVGRPNFHFMMHDIREPVHVEVRHARGARAPAACALCGWVARHGRCSRCPLARSPQVDQIFNLACPAAPIHYQSYPIKTWETCVLGTRNLLQLALEVGATFLQASTSEVYGEPLVHPQVEGYWGNVSCTGPRA